jgi:hypothetical protein
VEQLQPALAIQLGMPTLPYYNMNVTCSELRYMWYVGIGLTVSEVLSVGLFV